MEEQIVKRPPYRFKLRAQIAQGGFRTLQEIADELGVQASTLSRVVSGWEFPTPGLQRSMAEALRISMKEFLELL